MRTETKIRHHLGVCLASDVAIMGAAVERRRAMAGDLFGRSLLHGMSLRRGIVLAGFTLAGS